MMSKSRLTPGVRDKLARAGYTSDHVGRSFNAVTTPPAPEAGNGDVDVTIPDTVAGLEELLGDRKRMDALAAKNKLPEVIQAYVVKMAAKEQSLAVQIEEQVQAGIANFLRENDEGTGRLDLSGPISPYDKGTAKNKIYNPTAMGAKLDSEFQGPHAASEFFQLIWKNHKRTVDASDQVRLKKVRNAFGSDVPSDGGFLIPETLRSELLGVALEMGVVRSRARVIPMETLRVPFPAVDSTSNVSSVFGGVVAYWTEEGGTLTESSAKFKRIVLEAKKLTGYAEVPQELVADSIISFQPFISEIFPEALAFYEDIAFLAGTGAGEPLGALGTGNAAMVTVAKEAGQPADTIVWENIVKMYARMLPSSMGRAVWVASIDTFPELATMALSVGTGGSAIWLNNGVEGPPMTILGRPVIFTEKAPGLLGDLGDISFVDFGFYLIGDRQAMSVSASEHFKFQNDEIAFKVIERVDGRPWLQSAITPQNNGPALSAFVNLAARA